MPNLIFFALVLLLCAFDAPAQTAPSPPFPNGPIRVVVPYPPGGVNDATARIVAHSLGDALGVPVLVDNRPGGGTVIGTQIVAKAAPDGQTLLLVNPTSTINVSTFKTLPYDILKDFAPVSLIAGYPNLLVIGAVAPMRTLQELIASAKAQPGKLNYASGGNGGFTHLAGEWFKTTTGTDFVHVPFKGAPSTVAPLVNGEVTMAIGDFTTYLPLVKAGKLRALAVTSATRQAAVPDVPTMAEAGLAGFEADVWLGLVAPAGTPSAVVARLNSELAKVLATPGVVERMRAQGVGPMRDTPEEFAALLAADVERWRRVVAFAGIRVE